MITEIHGVMLYDESDVVVRRFHKKGKYEPILMQEWAGLAKHGGTMIDVGAYTGLFSIKAALVGGRNVDVHAFEIHPVTSQMLLSNCNLNMVEVHVHSVAAWHEDTKLTAYTFADRVASSSTTVIARDNQREFKVNARTLDGYNFRNVTAIKIDAERAEVNVVRGATKLLLEQSPVVFTEALSIDFLKELEAVFAPLGYAAELIEPNMYKWRKAC